MIYNYRNYLKESISKVTKDDFRITDDVFKISFNDLYIYNSKIIEFEILLNSNYIGWIKLSGFDTYFIHAYKYIFKKSPGSERYGIEIYYNGYHHNEKIDKCLASLNTSNCSITRCEGPNMDPIIRISDDDPFGEEDWRD